MIWTRDRVLSVVKREFPTEDPETIVALLDAYGVEPHETGRDRVQLAILKLSQGDPEKLLYWIDIAKRDYRDVLAFAEYPGQMRAPLKLAPDLLQKIMEEDRTQYVAWLLRGEPEQVR